jgi:hypothetical protein
VIEAWPQAVALVQAWQRGWRQNAVKNRRHLLRGVGGRIGRSWLTLHESLIIANIDTFAIVNFGIESRVTVIRFIFAILATIPKKPSPLD